jgi:hypothetical protein
MLSPNCADLISKCFFQIAFWYLGRGRSCLASVGFDRPDFTFGSDGTYLWMPLERWILYKLSEAASHLRSPMQ